MKSDQLFDAKHLLENVDAGVLVFFEHQMQWCSGKTLALLGYSTVSELRDAIGKGLAGDFLSDPCGERLWRRVGRSDLWLRLARSPVDWYGASATLVTITDLTAIKDRAQGVIKKYERLKRLVNLSPGLFATANRAGLIEYINIPFAKLLGGKPDDYVRASINEPELSRFLHSEALGKAMSGEESKLLKNVVNLAGQNRVFEFHYRPRYKEGLDGAYIFAFDVTERVIANTEFQASEARFQNLIDLIPLGILRLDMHGRITLLNFALNEMFGYPEGELDFAHIRDLCGSRNYDPGEQFFPSLLREPAAMIIRCERADGELIDVLMNWVHEYDEQRNVRGLIGVMTDTTDDMRARRELQEAKDAAERATHEKSRFLAAASHDLQQPLHSLSILLGLLNTHKDDEARRESILQLMERAVEGARELVRGVIDISKLEAGVVVPRITSFPLSELFSQIDAELGPLTADRPVTLKLMKTSAWIKSDPKLFKSILHNLVSNAIRYTSTGRILVGARQYGENLRILVYDTGRGIPENKQQDIFKEFTRLERGEGEDQSPGIGLGLSIVEHACKLLQHKLSFWSEVGKGSVFAIDVPFVSRVELGASLGADFGSELGSGAQVNDIPPPLNFGQRTGLILLIEDNILTTRPTRELLESWGHSCMTASSVAEAVRAIEESDRAPDMILADYNLEQDKTGLEIIDRVWEYFETKIPTILLTANDDRECEDGANERGIQIMKKPANPARLRALVTHCLTSRVDY